MTFMHGLLTASDESVSQDQPSDVAIRLLCGMHLPLIDHCVLCGISFMALSFLTICVIVIDLCQLIMPTCP